MYINIQTYIINSILVFAIHVLISIGESLPKTINDLANLQALLPYTHNGCHGPGIACQCFFAEHSPIDCVSKIITLCDYDGAKNSEFIA